MTGSVCSFAMATRPVSIGFGSLAWAWAGGPWGRASLGLCGLQVRPRLHTELCGATHAPPWGGQHPVCGLMASRGQSTPCWLRTCCLGRPTTPAAWAVGAVVSRHISASSVTPLTVAAPTALWVLPEGKQYPGVPPSRSLWAPSVGADQRSGWGAFPKRGGWSSGAGAFGAYF